MTGIEELEARVQRLEDLAAIHQLFIDYGIYLDAGDFAAYAQLFAEDGEALLGPMGRAKGPAAIEALMTTLLADRVGTTFHIVSSPQVSLDGDTASSTVMWTVVGRGSDNAPEVPMLGRHVDQLVRTPQGWRFQRRRGEMLIPATLPT
jgi:ketosteroid isomerase-like protein